LKGIAIQEKINKTGIGNNTFSGELEASWKKFTEIAEKNQVGVDNAKMVAAQEAYTKLN
jgi:hypothetical protein